MTDSLRDETLMVVSQILDDTQEASACLFEVSELISGRNRPHSALAHCHEAMAGIMISMSEIDAGLTQLVTADYDHLWVWTAAWDLRHKIAAQARAAVDIRSAVLALSH